MRVPARQGIRAGRDDRLDEIRKRERMSLEPPDGHTRASERAEYARRLRQVARNRQPHLGPAVLTALDLPPPQQPAQFQIVPRRMRRRAGPHAILVAMNALTQLG